MLGIDDQTMSRRFVGWERGGVVHAPVIAEPEPDPEWVSWFGVIHAFLMVELGMATCSISDEVAMGAFFRLLAVEFGMDCALGLEEVWLPEAFETISDLQQEASLSEDWWMVTESGDGDWELSSGAQSLFDRLEFEGGWARRMVLEYPLIDGEAPIYLDARKGRGDPIIRYLPICFIRSYIEAGETEQFMLEIYKDWDLSLSELRHAVQYAREHDLELFDFDDGLVPAETTYF